MSHQTEIRKYQCPDCKGRFWVDCDDDDYPVYCPHCRADNYRGDDHTMSFIKFKSTALINE